jgi:hypothetical protein
MAIQLPSLFGTQMEPEQMAEARALQFAQMSPQQQMQYNIYRNVNRLGRSVAGLLGADVQDPAMRKASQIRQLASQFNTNTPEGMMEFANALRQVDPQLAMQAAQQAQAMMQAQANLGATRALEQQRLREKQAADPFQKLVESGKYTPASLAVYSQSGMVSDLVLQEKEQRTNYGVEADRAAKARYNKNFNELTQAEARVIDDLLEERGIKKAKAGVPLPGVAKAGDVVGLRDQIQKITKPYQDQADAAGDAIDLANMAIKKNNFAAVSSLSRSLAKAAGETQLSGKDVEAFGIDPSLVGRVVDTVSRLAQSVPSVDTLTKLRQLAEALKKKAESRIAIEEEQLQETARVSKQFTEDQINTVFRRRPSKTPKQNTRTTRSGVSYTVEND